MRTGESVGLSAVLYGKHVNRATLDSFEPHAPISDAQPVGSRKFSFESFHVTFAGIGVPSEGEKNAHRGFPIHTPEFGSCGCRPDEAELHNPWSRRTSS